jgi:hypothetical protein
MVLNSMSSGLWAFLAGMLLLVFILAIAVYIYMGFAFMTIGKKAKLKTPELAWIPGVGPLIIAFQISKMHWWPWLLIIGMFIPFVNPIFTIVFVVFVVIWEWKMFEKLKRPGWWALLCLIPIVNFVLYGVAAWDKK